MPGFVREEADVSGCRQQDDHGGLVHPVVHWGAAT